jgi:GR25 family glycosyltransferase involved in LPS biosynthesis
MIRINDYFEKVYVISLRSDIYKQVKISYQLELLGIDYELFEAINGSELKFQREWIAYRSRPLVTPLEKQFNRKMIESEGAWGYLKTMQAILENAMAYKYNRILVLDDDCLFHNNFNEQFSGLADKLPADWKLLLLGASQYQWDTIEVQENFYRPKAIDTCGSFAVGYHSSVFQEILSAVEKMDTPFDVVPLGNIYTNYSKYCYVRSPYLVIADVGNSTIRGSRHQVMHSSRMKWDLKNFPYPVMVPVSYLQKKGWSIEAIETYYSEENTRMQQQNELGYELMTADNR